MNIESPSPGQNITPVTLNTTNTVSNDSNVKDADTKAQQPKQQQSNANSAVVESTTKVSLDEATGLMQSITTDKMTDKVIRKMPSDEYLRLRQLVDQMFDKKI